MAAWFLIAIFITILPSWAASDDGLSVSPLYDYRYSQVAENLGILSSGASESKLAYESIKTSSLNPQETPEDSGADTAGDVNFKQTAQTSEICPFETEDTCFASCGSTCTNTCAGTCGDSCGQTCMASCGSTCGSTCTNTCAPGCQTSTLTCAGTCGRTCGSTCSNTCANTCSRTCGYTCYTTCRNTCAPTCSNTCMSTCGYTCVSTCRSTCSSTCIQTCSATCGSKCNLIPAAVAPLANSTAKAPAPNDRNALLPYDTVARPPASVFYDGASLTWASFQKKFAGDYLLAWVDIQDGSWGVEARAPLGSWVREFIYVPVSGNLTLSEITPDGRTHIKDFGPATPGYRYVWHQADSVGMHSSVFAIGSTKSNEIDLTAF